MEHAPPQAGFPVVDDRVPRQPGTTDWRHISAGREIPSRGYCDQPFVVRTADGHWLCVMTTSFTTEGDSGQTVVVMRSGDHGRTWSEPHELEPSTGPEASWGVPFVAKSGRIYVFYVYNATNLRKIPAGAPFVDGFIHQVAWHGEYAFRYSDDHGVTWSSQRAAIPIRTFEIDRENPYGGDVHFFYTCSRPLVHAGRVYLPFAKVGAFGEGVFARTEVAFACSDNLLDEQDVAQLRWLTLPDGEVGLRAPAGAVGEEPSVVALDSGRLSCVFRTTQGYLCESFSDDLGHTWSTPEPARFAADGDIIKQPRAAGFQWRRTNGEYVLWFHNHSGRDYEGRNPGWICLGTDGGDRINWSQPEILLYDAELPHLPRQTEDRGGKTLAWSETAAGKGDAGVASGAFGGRISYPDLIEEGDTLFITETQKTRAAVHAVPDSIFAALRSQFDRDQAAVPPPAFELVASASLGGTEHAWPEMPDLYEGGGFTLEVSIHCEAQGTNGVLASTRDATGRGFSVVHTERGSLELMLHGVAVAPPRGFGQFGIGEVQCAWESDPGLLVAGRDHHVAFIVDGGPKTITVIVDGSLCDGGDQRAYGWARFSPWLRNVDGDVLRIGRLNTARLQRLRYWAQPLMVSHLVGGRSAL